MVMQTVLRRRALLAGEPHVNDSVQALFGQPPLQDRWQAVAADIPQARFLLQHNSFDAILIHDALRQPALRGLARTAAVPLVFLGDERPQSLTQAYRDGVAMCLPREMTLQHPPLLEAALDRAARLADDQRYQRATREQLEQCRRQIDRLVSLIWRSTPMEPNTRWFAQRFALERLDEEMARSGRHGTPLTLAVGELHADEAEHQDESALDEWMSETIARAKRRCDVAGQYGPNGFMLLMVQTPEPGGIICCRRLQKLLHAGPPSGDRPVRALIGLASSTGNNDSSHKLLRRAEESLEVARTGAGDSVVAL